VTRGDGETDMANKILFIDDEDIVLKSS